MGRTHALCYRPKSAPDTPLKGVIPHTTTTSQRPPACLSLAGFRAVLSRALPRRYAPGPYFSTVTDVLVIRIFAQAALLV
jgi:hypothetical protein